MEFIMEKVESLFNSVKPIILKFQKRYYIQLWDKEDWLQEGRVVLHALLTEFPDLTENDKRLYTYFKTKFSSYIKDVLRHQESYKRKFNKMPYEEIGEVSHKVASKGLVLDDYIAYQAIVEELKCILNGTELEQFYALVRGERFSGRKALLRKIKPYFIDFKE